jgi:hypothetical protein
MNSFWMTAGVVIVLVTFGGAVTEIMRRLDQGARERQQIMDAVARIEANTDWIAGMTEATDAQHRGRREAAESQIDFRRLR